MREDSFIMYNLLSLSHTHTFSSPLLHGLRLMLMMPYKNRSLWWYERRREATNERQMMSKRERREKFYVLITFNKQTQNLMWNEDDRDGWMVGCLVGCTILSVCESHPSIPTSLSLSPMSVVGWELYWGWKCKAAEKRYTPCVHKHTHTQRMLNDISTN